MTANPANLFGFAARRDLEDDPMRSQIQVVIRINVNLWLLAFWR